VRVPDASGPPKYPHSLGDRPVHANDARPVRRHGGSLDVTPIDTFRGPLGTTGDRAYETLAELVQAVSSCLDLGEALGRVAQAAASLLGNSASRIWVVEGERLVLRTEYGIRAHRAGLVTELGFGEGLTGHVARSGEILVLEDLIGDARAHNLAWLREEGFVSCAGLPLQGREGLVGVALLLTRARHHFTDREIRLLKLFASQAAIAIDNARLHTETRRRRETAEALAEIARLTSRTLDSEDTRQRIADSIRSLLRGLTSALYRLDPDTGELILLAASGKTIAANGGKLVRAPGTGIVGLAVTERRAVVTGNMLDDPRIVMDEEERVRVAESPCRAGLALPLLVQERVVGVLGVGRGAGDDFDADAIRLAQAFADQAAVALENARLYESQFNLLSALRTRQARLEALLEVGRQLARIQPVESLLERIAAACAHLFNASSVAFRLLEGEHLVLCGSWGHKEDALASPRLRIGESLTGLVAARGEALVVTNPIDDPRLLPAHREGYRRLGLRAFLGVPVKTGDDVVGVLSIRSSREEGFTEADVELAATFASQAAIALENSRLYHKTQRAFDELTQAQDQLAQARKMEAVGLLAGGVAHDFNNMLMVMLGRSDLLLRRLPGADPMRRDLELIRSTGQRAADLTRQLLAFSRKQVLEPRVLSLNAVVGELAPMLERLIGETIELRTALATGLGDVRADRGQMEQVIMNLVVNARDAMPRGGRLTVETKNVELDAAAVRGRVGMRPGPHVLLAITDSGMGMDEATQARIFEPFFTTKPFGEGTGLGLATVHGIINQSGGTIWVYSEPGKGTTFKIYLPRVTEGAAGPSSESAADETPRGSETILLVEDQGDVRDYAHDVLAAQGYTVLLARDGADALEVARVHTGRIHLLLTDVVMPRMSGRELAERLTTTRPDVAVLYMSGYPDRAVVDHGILGPGVTFLQKPVAPDALARKVREMMDGRRPHPA
jgi:signal transduction histidine kinase/ActR/RegA family two-component response regulator